MRGCWQRRAETRRHEKEGQRAPGNPGRIGAVEDGENNDRRRTCSRRKWCPSRRGHFGPAQPAGPHGNSWQAVPGLATSGLFGRDAWATWMSASMLPACCIRAWAACSLPGRPVGDERVRGGEKKYEGMGPLLLALGGLIGWSAPATTSSVSLIWEGSWVCRFFFSLPSFRSVWLPGKFWGVGV